MKKLRLLLFEDCNRTCAGYCNRDWDLATLPEVEGYAGYDEVLLTGGEPMLNLALVMHVIADIRAECSAKIYVYTAMVADFHEAVLVLGTADGMCVTLHDQSDVAPFRKFNKWLLRVRPAKSLRLNIFEGVDVGDADLSLWTVKHVRWLKNCPLPADEVFMRLPRASVHFLNTT